MRECRECSDAPCSCPDPDPLHGASALCSRHNGQPIIEQNELEWLVRSIRYTGRGFIPPPPPPRRPPDPYLDPVEYRMHPRRLEQPPAELMKALARAVFESPEILLDIAAEIRIGMSELGELLTGRQVHPEVIRRAQAWLTGTPAPECAPSDSPRAARWLVPCP
jgi:hypothetical protein